MKTSSSLSSRPVRPYLARENPAKKPETAPFCVVDIETVPIGRGTGTVADYIMGAYWRSGDPEVVHWLASPEDWWEALWDPVNRGRVWYAHNGGEFDFKFLLPVFLEHLSNGLTVEVVSQGQRVIGFILRRRLDGVDEEDAEVVTVELRDAYALMPSSLKELTEKLAPEVAKRSGAINFATEQFDPDNPTHRDYLWADVIGLGRVIERFRLFVHERFRVRPAWTAGATALKAWLTTLGAQERYHRIPPEAEAFIRRAYYGGMVFLRRQRAADQVHVDVNSMYPYAMMAFGVPDGRPVFVTEERPGWPGFYEVEVDADDVAFTFVPCRNGKVTVWPRGRFVTRLSTLEIAEARRRGYRIRVRSGWVFSRVAYPFRAFVEACQAIRTDPQYHDTAVEMVTKIMQNALYGKFGTRPLVERLFLMAPGEALTVGDLTPVVDERTGEPIEGLWWREETVDKPYLMVHWAAWITAAARVHLARLVYDAGPDAVTYGDTDSVVMDRAAWERVAERWEGKLYGQVKVEAHYGSFVAAAPKVYAGFLDGGTGFKVKAKGIPRAERRPEHVLATVAAIRREDVPAVDFGSMRSTRRWLKEREAYWRTTSRHYSSVLRSDGWQLVGNAVRPIRLESDQLLDTRKLPGYDGIETAGRQSVG